jgi:hypothetical protein
MVLSAACALATLLNPYHAQLYSVVLQYATQPGPYRLIVELMALDFREPGDWAVLGLTVAAAFTLGRGGRPSAFDVLLMLGTAYVSYRARRDAWLVVVAALGVVAAGMARKVREVEFRLTPARAGWVTAAVGMVLFFAIRARGLDEGGLAARAQAQLPVQAAAHVAEHGYPGPLYNHFNWGGYLIWALPDRPVAIDGRTNVQGDERIFRYERTWNGFPGWETDPDLQKAGVVVADRDRPLTALLRGDRRFTSVYEDDTAVVFVRRTAAAAP